MGESSEKNVKIGRHAAAEDIQNKQNEPEAAQPAEEGTAPETANAEAQETVDDRENAPRSAAPAAPRRGRKKINLAFACVMLALALALGGAGGWLIARQGAPSEDEAQTDAAILVVTPVPTAQIDESLTDAEREALDALAGGDEAAGDMSILLGEDDIERGIESSLSADGDVVVAEYDGGSVLSGEVAEAYSAQMTGLIFSGFAEEEVGGSVLSEVLENLVSERISERHAREMGLYELTDADKAAIEAEAEESYQAQLDFYKQLLDTSGMTAEEANGAAKAYLQEDEGVTLASTRSEIESGWWKRKLFDALTKDVTVDDAQVRAAYDELVAEQQQSFTAYPDDYESAQMNGETIVYNLPGYRAVRMLLIGFDNQDAMIEAMELREALANGEADETAQARLDELYAPVEVRAQAALDEIKNGADFESLIEQIGADEGMQDPLLRAAGYYVAKDSPLWPAEMASAAMALKSEGEVSGLVRMDGGVAILQYVGNVPEGAVAFEQVQDTLRSQTLESAKQTAYDDQLNAWIEAAHVKYYPERMQ